MILSNVDIRDAINAGDLIVEPPPPPDHFATSSLDLRVGYQFKKWKANANGVQLNINLSKVKVPDCGQYIENVPLDRDGLITVPRNDFILALTLEKIKLPLCSKLAARVEGRSSLARFGLAVHITAPIIHSGFSGPIVLEIKNLGPHSLKIEPGKTCICQLVFERLSSVPAGELKTVFQDQKDVLGR